MDFKSLGLGETGAGQSLASLSTLVPARPGVSLTVAQQSCVNAGGTWDGVNNGCNLPPNPNSDAWYCSIPFSTSLFSDCKLPATPQDLLLSAPYVAYQAGMMQNDPTQATAIIQQALGQGTDLLANQDCEYKAAAANPTLAQAIGPWLTCSLTSPFDPTHFGWALYIAAAVGGFLLLRGVAR